jgi:hypothetical protein
MTAVLLQHPLIRTAMNDARRWCAGHLIEQRPAFRHAVAVAHEVIEHTGDPAPELIAAALLHDAPEFAPTELDLDTYLTATYGAATARLVNGLHAEHTALDGPDPAIEVSDPDLLLLSTADKVVAFRGNLRRAHASADVPAYFAAKTGMLRLLPYFRAFRQAGLGRVPAALSADLARSLDQVQAAAAAFPTRTST